MFFECERQLYWWDFHFRKHVCRLSDENLPTRNSRGRKQYCEIHCRVWRLRHQETNQTTFTMSNDPNLFGINFWSRAQPCDLSLCVFEEIKSRCQLSITRRFPKSTVIAANRGNASLRERRRNRTKWFMAKDRFISILQSTSCDEHNCRNTVRWRCAFRQQKSSCKFVSAWTINQDFVHNFAGALPSKSNFHALPPACHRKSKTRKRHQEEGGVRNIHFLSLRNALRRNLEAEQSEYSARCRRSCTPSQARRVSPKSFDVIERALCWLEKMRNNIDEIDNDPACSTISICSPCRRTLRLTQLVDRFTHRFHLALACS